MNLGYACINTALSEQPKSKRVTTNRSMIKKTFLKKGINYAGELALENIKDLLKVLEWNDRHNIRFFRVSSDLFLGAPSIELLIYLILTISHII